MLNKIALTLVIIGAIVWCLVGIFNYNVVAAIFGAASVAARTVYTIIGIAGIWCISLLFRDFDERGA